MAGIITRPCDLRERQRCHLRATVRRFARRSPSERPAAVRSPLGMRRCSRDIPALGSRTAGCRSWAEDLDATPGSTKPPISNSTSTKPTSGPCPNSRSIPVTDTLTATVSATASCRPRLPGKPSAARRCCRDSGLPQSSGLQADFSQLGVTFVSHLLQSLRCVTPSQFPLS
jgi:hypothetical protein